MDDLFAGWSRARVQDEVICKGIQEAPNDGLAGAPVLLPKEGIHLAPPGILEGRGTSR